MALRMSEKQFAELQRSGFKGGARIGGARTPSKREVDDYMRDYDARTQSRARNYPRKRRARKQTFLQNYGPALAWGGAGMAVGLIATLMQSSSGSSLRGYVGTTPSGPIGGAIGGVIGSITGIPGLGQIGSLIGGLFGPTAKYTPGGLLDDTAFEGLKAQAIQVVELINQLNLRTGLPPFPVPSFTMTSSDDPKVGPYLAVLLNNPALASATTPDALLALAQNGTYDAALKVQQTLMQSIQQALSGLSNGSLVVINHHVVPVSQQGSYSATTGTTTAPPPNSYSAVQQSAPPTPGQPSTQPGMLPSTIGGFSTGEVIFGSVLFIGLLFALKS